MPVGTLWCHERWPFRASAVAVPPPRRSSSARVPYPSPSILRRSLGCSTEYSGRNPPRRLGSDSEEEDVPSTQKQDNDCDHHSDKQERQTAEQAATAPARASKHDIIRDAYVCSLRATPSRMAPLARRSRHGFRNE